MQGALEPIDAKGRTFALQWHRDHANSKAAGDIQSLACAEYWMKKRARQSGMVSVSESEAPLVLGLNVRLELAELLDSCCDAVAPFPTDAESWLRHDDLAVLLQPLSREHRPHLPGSAAEQTKMRLEYLPRADSTAARIE